MKNKDIKSIDETPDEEKWRMISILSYVIVLIAFGLPIWWFTTRVYRATLPLEDMLDLEGATLCPLQVEIQATGDARARALLHDIQSILGSTVHLSQHPNKLALPLSSQEVDVENSAAAAETSAGHLLFIEWPGAIDEFTITSHRVIYFNSDVTGNKLALFLQQWPGVDQKTALADPNFSRAHAHDTLRTYPAGQHFDVLITIVNPDPKSARIKWDLQQAVNQYLKSFLKKLESVANFKVKSQWLYFVDLGVKPRQVGPHWALAEQLLPHIITPLEKKLSSHVSKHPCVNLVVYVPGCAGAPLTIYTKKGVKSAVNAFISPRWGGIQIANPNCTTDFVPDSREIMSIFVTQLTQLLGLGAFSVQKESGVRQTGLHPSDIQVDYLRRAHTLEYFTNAKLTLRSLAQLLSEISNIVINDEVALSVQNAVDNIKKGGEALRMGRIEEAFECSKMAAASSESAFTDPSLLALLYFPDDQKYAVYIPLFLPIMIPVIMSMKQLLQYSKRTKNNPS